MEVLKAHSSSSTFYEPKRYPNFIDLDTSYKLLGDVFRVDDLLDFSNEEIAGPIAHNATAEGKAKDEAPIGDGLDQVEMPGEDELGWLSNFVEDSSSIEDEVPNYAFKSTSRERSRHGMLGEEVNGNGNGVSRASTSEKLVKQGQFVELPTTVPGRARSKRSRAGTPNKRFLSYEIPEASNPTSSSDYEDSGTAASDPSSILDDTGGPYTAESKFSDERRPPPKKSKKGSTSKRQSQQQGDSGSSSSSQQEQQQVQQSQQSQQKCLHCGSQKTPQWRTGPLGPKTLCNACGVRFKSGRLFPEYRPAASPSFVPQMHSNSHKRVLEMRRQKLEGSD